MEDLTAEIGQVSNIVAKYFPIYDTRVSPNVFSFFVRVDEATLEENFDKLRMEMKPLMYVPILTLDGGEQVIHVQKRPRVRYRSVKVNLILLAATIATTVFAGMMHWSGYQGIPLYSLESLSYGTVFFAFPLLAILATHEFGHYFMAKRHKVAASLPFFIPSFPPLGTFGAVISMRDPIPNRKALLDIGIAGPIFGLIVAVPVTAIGLYLTSVGAKPVPVDMGEGGGLMFFPPLLFQALESLIPIPSNVLSHPTAFAGWVGLFVTALNLIPAGQLDGGHIARALLGKRATYVSYLSLLVLFIFGFLYFGWMLIGLLILLLGATHPPPLNDLTPLDNKRRVIGSFAAVILVLCFVIVPVAQIPVENDFDFRDANYESISEINLIVAPNTTQLIGFYLNNTGNVRENVSMQIELNQSMIASGWQMRFAFEGDGAFIDVAKGKGSLYLNASDGNNITLVVVVPPGASGDYTITIYGLVEADSGTAAKGTARKDLTFIIRVQ